jgi:hypothetical protein
MYMRTPNDDDRPLAYPLQKAQTHTRKKFEFFPLSVRALLFFVTPNICEWFCLLWHCAGVATL